ncbi:DUF916 domain-containing protein [Streptomyces sp. NPDC059070]|uniref:COG1470 family protein n=1 Tax=unclassified Streptomyces TaxID=2593676 RepID=UPI0034E29D7E
MSSKQRTRPSGDGVPPSGHGTPPSSRGTGRRAGPLLLALGLLLACAALPATAARAADNGRWSVFPVQGRPGAPARAYFKMTADRGETVRDRVTVKNLGAGPATFLLYGTDGYNTPRDGGFAVRGRNERMTGVGAWTHLDRSQVTLAPGAEVTVPFTVTVPEGAEPGDHPGAVVALDTHLGRADGNGVAVQQAVGARVYLKVNGARTRGLRIEDVKFRYAAPLVPGAHRTATISYALVNSGNVMLSPQVDLRAKGVFGHTAFEPPGHRLPAELLPGQRVEVTQKWSGPPLVDWGSIEVTASDRGGDLVENAEVGYATVNWTVVALAGLVVLGATAWLVLRRRAAGRGERAAL